jgi:tetratricopeptide (TPR) repeat protein
MVRIRMKQCAIILGLLFTVSVSGHAADDPVQKALKAYEKHQYDVAARDLRAALPSLPQGKQASARLALGMLYLKNAELHRAFAGMSLAVNTDYLKRLAKDTGRERSRYADLYLGLAYLEAGKPDDASAQIGKFLAGGGDAKEQAVARIALGSAAHLQGDERKAQESWGAVDAADPDVRSEIAGAYSSAGLADKDPVLLCDGALAELKKTGVQPSAAMVKNCCGVYGRAGAFDKGFDLLQRGDLKAYSYRESIGRSKALSFHAVPLLSNLAAFYLRASVAELDRAATDQQLSGIANFYLGEAYLFAGDRDRATRATTAFLASPQLPAQIRNKALVRQAEIRHVVGRQADARGVWDELARSQPGDPELLSDILSACGRLRADCPRLVQTSTLALERGEGRTYMALNAGLGRYYLGQKEYAKALTHLEAGRDKGNKNKIEANDPLLLVELADAAYRTKKYSEALEIFFEMSKQFPEVRQIQDALQGVYSMEQKSAGDVKIN